MIESIKQQAGLERDLCGGAGEQGQVFRVGSRRKTMAENSKPVELGALAIDCTSMAPFVQDLVPGALVGMRSRQPGYDDVLNEITSNQPTLGGRAGVTDEDIQAFLLANERIAMIDAQLPAARKLVELLEETRGKLDDQCQRQVSAVAVSVESRAKAYGDDELLARYEKTRAYRSAIGLKAARTRRKNAAGDTTASDLAGTTTASDLAGTTETARA
jgi:hypothetical protein